MNNAPPATPKEMIWIGTGFAIIGLYFILVGFGVLPVPGGPDKLHSPLWVVICAGVPFFLGGLAVFLQGIGKGGGDGRLPADTPIWLRAMHHLFVVLILTCFALIGSWIALAGDPRQFSGSIMGFGVGFGFGPGFGVGVGRAVFGIGALICWACAIGVAISTVRKLAGARKIP